MASPLEGPTITNDHLYLVVVKGNSNITLRIEEFLTTFAADRSPLPGSKRTFKKSIITFQNKISKAL